MPDGIVQWLDPSTDDVAVVRRSRIFPASINDLDAPARHPGAHVHFDVLRDGGVERAVNVTLRRGTRVSERQHRFGSLVGAHRRDTKGGAPFGRPHPELGLSLASHPMEVARAWAGDLEAGEVDAALARYAPDAQVHAPGLTVAGRAHLQAYLEGSALLAIGGRREIRGEDGLVLVRWDGAAGEVEVRSRLEHGMIAEQWVDTKPPSEPPVDVPGRPGVAIAVTRKGRVDDEEVAYGILRLSHVVEQIGEPVLFASLKLSRATDPARSRPAMVQATLDVDGELVRAHVAGHEMHEAVDVLQRRLHDKLQHRAEHRGQLRTRGSASSPGEWRHGDAPTVRPEFYERPVDDRELVRHKTIAVDELTPDEAAFDMEQLDHDFLLFGDLATGEDAVLERRDDATYHLTRLHPSPIDTEPTAIGLTVDEHPAPVLSVRDAIERLDAGAERFVFFANTTTERGNVVYRRYDGHYGLLTVE